MIHPAHRISYDELYGQLQEAVQRGEVKEQLHRDGDLRLYCYTDETVYDRKWNCTTMLARGLILDVAAKNIAATPFTKFFNYGEIEGLPPEIKDEIKLSDFMSEPFETFEKLDGSLIILFFHNGKWKTATKGSFYSEQAAWAQAQIDGSVHSNYIDRSYTFLLEAIYPENRIVVNYGEFVGFKLLGAYDRKGIEADHYYLKWLAKTVGWGIAQKHEYQTIQQLIDNSNGMTCQEEGYVVRSSSGQRLKIKGAEYCRVHRLVSNLTPLSLWRSLKEREDLDLMRRSLPEEFWADFDSIIDILQTRINNLLYEISELHLATEKMTNKEIGLQLHDYPDHLRSFIFPYRKFQDRIIDNERTRHTIFESFRPTRNVLEGYTPSTTVIRVYNEQS